MTPAGLDTVVVKDAAGDTLAASGGIAVPPALPLFSVRRADSLPQVPGIPLTHFWRLRNAGPVDGIALLLFMLPAYMGPPVLDLPVLPEDTVVLGTGSTSQVRWMEFAVSVGAYGTVDVPVTTDLPPGAVFGTGAPAAPGTFVPLSMTVQAMVPASGWGTVVANAQPGPVTAARAGAAEASGVEEALGALARGTTAARGAYAGALETAFPTLAAALFSKGTFTTLIHAFGLRGGGAS